MPPPPSQQPPSLGLSSHSLNREPSILLSSSRAHPYRFRQSAKAQSSVRGPTSSPPSTRANTPLGQSSFVSDKAFGTLKQFPTEGPPCTTSYLFKNDALDAVGLRIHKTHFTLHCLDCQFALLPTTIKTHMNTRHQLKLDGEQCKELMEICTAQGVSNTHAVKLPSPRGPPIESLAIVTDAHCCKECAYCVPSFVAFRQHWGRSHKNHPAKPHDGFTVGFVQTFFVVPVKYFEVLPQLAALPKDDVYALYLRDEVPKMMADDDVILPPIMPSEVPPLLQSTGWHLHLKDILVSKRSVRYLRLFMEPAKRSGPNDTLALLADAVKLYMRKTRDLCNNSDVRVRKMLMQCPL